jgi:hypothetical protein
VERVHGTGQAKSKAKASRAAMRLARDSPL